MTDSRRANRRGKGADRRAKHVETNENNPDISVLHKNCLEHSDAAGVTSVRALSFASGPPRGATDDGEAAYLTVCCCFCFAALPRRTWDAGVETSAGNIMVL